MMPKSSSSHSLTVFCLFGKRVYVAPRALPSPRREGRRVSDAGTAVEPTVTSCAKPFREKTGNTGGGGKKAFFSNPLEGGGGLLLL